MNARGMALRALVLAVAVAVASGCSDGPDKLLAKAKDHLAKNDRSAAIIELRNALQKKGDMAEARFLLGKALIETNDLNGAEKELRRASELAYPPEEVIPALARIYAKRGEYKKIVDEMAKTQFADKVATADLQTSLGNAYLALNDLTNSKIAFAAALAAQPDYPGAVTGQARLMATAGDIAGGLALMESTVAKSPTFTEAWQLKGDLLLAQNKIDEAIEAYRKAYQTKPDQLIAYYQTVTLLVQQGKAEEAAKEFAAMQKIAAKHPLTYYLQALLAYRDKNYAAARDAIQLHLKAAPDNLPGMLLGAQIDYQLGSYTQAQAALGSIVARAPKQAFARRLLVQAYLREGRPGKALEALQPLLQDGANDSDTLALAGEVYAQSGEPTVAGQYFDRAAALDPKSAGKRTAAAITHFAKGDDARGIAELEAAAAADTGIRADLALVAANLKKKNFDAALAAVDAIEKKQPNPAVTNNLRGTVLATKGDIAGARKAFEASVAADPVYFPAAQSLARLDLQEKKLGDARKRFDAILAKDPKNVQAMLALAALQSQSGGSSEDVAKLINNAIVANPAEPAPRLALIALRMKNKEPKQAVAAAQEAVAALPERPEILDAAGIAYVSAGNYNQAIATYTKLAQIRPDSPLPLLRMAETHVANKDFTAARSAAQKALDVKPDSIEAQRMMIALDVNAGKGPEALNTAREMQKQRPTESIGYVLEGDLKMRDRQFPEAIEAYRNGLKAAGTSDLAIRIKAAMELSGKKAESDAFAASWLKDHPKDILFRHYMGEVAIKANDFPAAVRQYNAIIEIDPNEPLALNNLAWLLSQQRDPKAMGYAERAYALAPGNPAVADTYGVLLVDKGEAARGIDVLERAVTAAPNASQIRLNFARALIKGGRKDEAKRELETLAKLGDKFPEQAEVTKMMQGL